MFSPNRKLHVQIMDCEQIFIKLYEKVQFGFALSSNMWQLLYATFSVSLPRIIMFIVVDAK